MLIIMEAIKFGSLDCFPSLPPSRLEFHYTEYSVEAMLVMMMMIMVT